MGAFLQYHRVHHRDLDQLADEEEEAPGPEEKGIKSFAEPHDI